jgi:hypothetical protein
MFMEQSKYDAKLTEADGKLRVLTSLANRLDQDILKFIDDPNDTDLCISIVRNILEARTLSDQLVFRIIPAIQFEDERIAAPIELARTQLVEKILAIETDLNRIIQKTKPEKKPPERVLRLVGS